MKLTLEEEKALELVLKYIGPNECEHYYCADNPNPKSHIWINIRGLYLKVFGQKALSELEGRFK